MFQFSVNTVPGDGLADEALGASAVTMRTKLRSCIIYMCNIYIYITHIYYTGPELGFIQIGWQCLTIYIYTHTHTHTHGYGTGTWRVYSLALGKFKWNFRYLIFMIISGIGGCGISCELALRWMSLDLTDDKSTLFPVMAWCRQATSHYLSQCWPRSLSPYGVTRPQWVKTAVICERLNIATGFYNSYLNFIRL